MAYIFIRSNALGARIGIVKYGESGYYQTNLDNGGADEDCREHIRFLNQRIDVSPEVADAMLYGSMFGWHVPIAQPAHVHFGPSADGNASCNSSKEHRL
jgi:hypothetical protein